jgi:hypothetical protein
MARPCRSAFFATRDLPCDVFGPVLRPALRRFARTRALDLIRPPADGRSDLREFPILDLIGDFAQAPRERIAAPVDFAQDHMAARLGPHDHPVNFLESVALDCEGLRGNGFLIDAARFRICFTCFTVKIP